MIECFACSTRFKIEFEDEDTQLNFCPNCGEESVDEILLDGESDNSLIDPVFDIDNDDVW
jgi:rRNA maturation endonuclease Nob1